MTNIIEVVINPEIGHELTCPGCDTVVRWTGTEWDSERGTQCKPRWVPHTDSIIVKKENK